MPGNRSGMGFFVEFLHLMIRESRFVVSEKNWGNPLFGLRRAGSPRNMII